MQCPLPPGFACLTREPASPSQGDNSKDKPSSVHDKNAPSIMPEPGRALAIACVLAAMVLVVLNTAIANVALPSIAGPSGLSPLTRQPC